MTPVRVRAGRHQAFRPPPPEWLALARAVRKLWDRTEAGPPCSEQPDRWLTPRGYDVPALQQVCQGCPLYRPCRDAAPAASAGVWGGIPRGSVRRPRTPRNTSNSAGTEPAPDKQQEEQS